jgi:hypothetical protein
MRSLDRLSRIVRPAAEEALCLPATKSRRAHVLFVRVPVRNKLIFLWCCQVPTDNREMRRETTSWGTRLLTDFLFEQLQAADIWADWGETGWRIGAVVPAPWLEALRNQDGPYYGSNV